MQLPKSSILLFIFSSLMTLSFVLGDYVDLVIESEKELALSLDKFVDDHPDTYDFIARTLNNEIIVEIRFEDDSIGIQGIFTETQGLLDELDIAQRSVWQATQVAGLQEFTNGSSIDILKDYRYNPDGDVGVEKRQSCQPCRTCLRDVNEHLKKRQSFCGQFCSTRLSCVVPGCRRCYYTGGACLWQKSCRRN